MVYQLLIAFVISFLIFSILFVIGKVIYTKLDKSNSRFLNPLEYLPEDEVTTLKQVFYLIMMLVFFIFMIYTLFIVDSDIKVMAILEIVVLLYVAITLDYSSWKTKAFFFLLVPYGSISFLIYPNPEINLLDLLHIISYIYLMKLYYGKFKTYTETNSLGITIILLFAIISISFINTIIVENTGPLIAMVMVSNAFTSNGYAVLGSSSLGKLNSILLVWGGYIISGAGTATLTAAIIIKHFNKRIDKLEEMIKNEK